MLKLLVAAALAIGGLCQYSPPPNATSNATFTNPIVDTGADPWMFRHGDFYYMTYTNNVNITLWRSKSLTDWAGAESKTIFKPEPNKPYSTDLWAPEIHQVDGAWWVIFTADPNYDSPPPEVEMWCEYNCPAVNHRMFVVRGEGDDPWTATYQYHSELETYDQFAIDGTYFQHKDQLYHIYSCWYHKYDGWPANLCITNVRSVHNRFALL
jgi:GH43 family beta-xylosidase